MDTVSLDNSSLDNSTIIYINNAEMDQELKDLLEEWGISESLCFIFISFGITKLNFLREFELSDIGDLFGKIDNIYFAQKVLFKANLRKWRKEQQIPMICDDETVSTTTNSRILEWLEKISTEISNQSWSSSPSTPNPTNNTATNNNLDALLKSTIKGTFIIEYYAEHNNLNQKKQNDLVHCIVDSFLIKKQKMSYKEMQQWANSIEGYFPTEKSTTYYMKRKKGAKNPTGKLHSRWCNVTHPKPINELGCTNDASTSNSDKLEETDEDMITTKVWLKFNLSPWDEIINNWRKTSVFRNRELKQMGSMKDILEEWPLYNHHDGHQLIDIDFETVFPQKQILLLNGFEAFVPKIIKYYNEEINDKNALEHLHTINTNKLNKESRNCLIVLLLHAVLHPMRLNRKHKQTILDAQEDFFNTYHKYK